MINTQLDLKNVTLGEWLSLWYDTYKKPKLKPNSLRNIEQQIRLHTPEWLKQIPIKDVTVFDIDKALSEMSQSRTAQYTRQVWHSAFVKAEKLDIVKKNVISLSENVKYKKETGSALTITEQYQFFQALENTRYKWVMLFYILTGVRRAEAVTIEWSDIDEKAGLIWIKGTKTERSSRYILLTNEVKTVLEEQRKQNEREKEKRSRGQFHKAPDTIIFPFTAETLSRTFKKLCPNHHLHDLRHTFATRCAESGVNINVCQQLLGHSTPYMTLSVYTHVMDDFKRSEALKYKLFPDFST